MKFARTAVVVRLLTCLLWSSSTEGQLSGDLRLTNGPNSTSGRLEIYYSSQWGTICDDGFGPSDALVACRQLGFSNYIRYGNILTFGYPQPSSGTRIWLDELACTGSESSLQSCGSNGYGSHDCSHFEDVALTCSGSPSPPPSSSLSVRLVGKNERTSSMFTAGRVEVFYSGQWGTVCDDSFTSSEASVICRQLGFSGYQRYGTVGSSGIGFDPASSSTPIWLDNFYCSLSDNTLDDCSFTNGIGVHNCAHSEDVVVFCLGNGALRLTPGTTSGRLEVYYNGEWGTVCDDFFGQVDADVACRQLGFDSASSYGDVYDLGYSPASFSVDTLLDNVQCTSSDIILSSCTHRGFGVEDCSHSEDVAVSCRTSSAGLSAGAAVGISLAVLLPCLCIGICTCVMCIYFCKKSSKSGSGNTVRTTTVGQSPYPTSAAVTTITTTGATVPQSPPTAYTAPHHLKSMLQQEPPPPYPGTQDTHPVQLQPTATAYYGGYPQANLAPYPYPAAAGPYQSPVVYTSGAPSPQSYPVAPPPVPSAPPPQASTAYPVQPGQTETAQHFEMQPQYAAPQPYPPTANSPAYPEGVPPYPAGVPSQNYSPPTN